MNTEGQAYTTKEGVFVNLNAINQGYFNSTSDMNSILGHEANTEYGHKSENLTEKYTFLKHSKVYLGQSQTDDFSKTSDKLKLAVAGNYGSFIYMAAVKGEISFKEMDALKVSFNKLNTGNVEINYIDSQDVIVKYNNKYFKYDSYRDDPY